MGLRGLKITMVSKPCPGQAGRVTLLTSSLPYLQKRRANGYRTRREKEKREKMRVSTEAHTRETGIQLCSPTGYMVDLAATKESYYRDSLQLSV
jgi:hypothetical protein